MKAIFQSYTHDYNAAPIWWCSLNVYLVRVTGRSKIDFTFLVSEKELGSLKATDEDNATSLPNGSIPEAAGKLSEITGYFHLSVINFVPSVLFCIILLLNEHHWNCKSKTANYEANDVIAVLLKMYHMTRALSWSHQNDYMTWNCHDAAGMIIWSEHCHEASGDDHMTWTLSWSPRGWSHDLNIVMKPAGWSHDLNIVMKHPRWSYNLHIVMT